MTKKNLLIMTILLATSTLVIGVAFTQNLNLALPTNATTTPYSCSSLHFGMNDNDLSGKYTTSINLYSLEKWTDYNGYIGVNTMEMNFITFSKSGAYHKQGYALLMNNCTMSFETPMPLTSIDIYCKCRGSKGQTQYTFGVNYVPYDIGYVIDDNGWEDYDITYEKHHIELGGTSYIEITAYSNDLLIGDIAFRY